jgi:hypothetical protein
LSGLIAATKQFLLHICPAIVGHNSYGFEFMVFKKYSFSPEFMTRCQNHGGWYQWGAVLMEVATTTTHIQ